MAVTLAPAKGENWPSAVADQPPWRETIGHIILGVTSMLMLGALPMLLAGLVDEGKMSLSGIGVAFTVIMLSMGVVNSLAGMLLKPRNLRFLALASMVILIALDVIYPMVGETGIFILCGFAGIVQGVLLWLGLGAIVRRMRVPMFWAAILFASTGIVELINSSLLARFVLPSFGIAAGFHLVALVSAAGFIGAILIPNRFDPIPDSSGDAKIGSPPVRGWIALFAAMLIGSTAGSVLIYLLPLLHSVGLDVYQTRMAQSFGLAGQVVGGIASTFFAARFGYLRVLSTAAVLMIGCMILYALHAPAWIMFISVAFFGGSAVFLAPFLVPMAIRADPSRRAATQLGSASLLGSALGPFIASRFVETAGVASALYVAGSLMTIGMAIVFALHLTAPRTVLSEAVA